MAFGPGFPSCMMMMMMMIMMHLGTPLMTKNDKKSMGIKQ